MTERAVADPGERDRIVEAAYQILAANDGANVSVREILRGAGLSTRAFYRHFQSKDDLLLAMLRDEADAITDRLDAVAAGADTPPRHCAIGSTR